MFFAQYFGRCVCLMKFCLLYEVMFRRHNTPEVKLTLKSVKKNLSFIHRSYCEVYIYC